VGSGINDKKDAKYAIHPVTREVPLPHITGLVLDGCLFSATAGLMDAFSIANLWQSASGPDDAAPLFETEIVSIDGRPVTALGGVRLEPRRSIADVVRTDVILVPPLLPNIGPPPSRMANVLGWLVDQYRRHTLIGALCTGTFILAETGLLDGKTATTNWQYARLFQRRYPRVRLLPDQVLTEDSGLICSGAATSFFQLALHLIEAFGSDDLARTCAKALLVDPNRASQAPYAIADFPRDHGDAGILKAQQVMAQRFAEALAIDDVAREVGISPRHFKRRFKQALGETPLGYLQRVRIEAAKQRLECSRAPVSEITWQIGYTDTSSFCRLFKKTTGLSPRDYRERFARPRPSCT
jgi:transcriptional regulator GlxA family with amidase domain